MNKIRSPELNISMKGVSDVVVHYLNNAFVPDHYIQNTGQHDISTTKNEIENPQSNQGSPLCTLIKKVSMPSISKNVKTTRF